MTIADAIKDFLLLERNKKNESTIEQYIWTMELFDDYLAHYADISKTKPDPTYEETIITGDISEISDKHIHDFLNIFLIKKICASSDELETYLKVIKDFFTWLADNKHINNNAAKKILNTIKEAEDLPKTATLSELLFNIAEENIKLDPLEKLSGYFKITGIFKNHLSLNEINIKKDYTPVVITKEISQSSKIGFILHLEIGLINDEWHITQSGNVYLKMIN